MAKVVVAVLTVEGIGSHNKKTKWWIEMATCVSEFTSISDDPSDWPADIKELRVICIYLF